MCENKKMTKVPIHKVHIADGFTDDCEELIHKCLQVDIFNYQVFCEIWKDMNFVSAFQGRASGAETAELSEELIVIAKHYMVANPSNFQESVIGLFLVYALVNLQPFSGFAMVRMVPEDIDAVLTIQSEARRLRRLDVLYILSSLLVKHSEYVADLRQRSMETGFKKYLTEPATISHQGIRPKGVFYRQNEELDVIRQLNFLGRRYAHAKAFVKNGENRNLKYVDEKMASNLERSIKNIINGILEPISDSNNTDNSSQGNNVAQTIKEKAMKGAVNSIRHLTSVDQMYDQIPDKDKEKQSTNKKSGGNMSPSTSVARKRKSAKGIRKFFRKKRKLMDSSSESEELSQSSHACDKNDDDDEINPAKPAKDLPVINFNEEEDTTLVTSETINYEFQSVKDFDGETDNVTVEEFEVQSDGEMKKIEKKLTNNDVNRKLRKAPAKRTRRKLRNTVTRKQTK